MIMINNFIRCAMLHKYFKGANKFVDSKVQIFKKKRLGSKTSCSPCDFNECDTCLPPIKLFVMILQITEFCNS